MFLSPRTSLDPHRVMSHHSHHYHDMILVCLVFLFPIRSRNLTHGDATIIIMILSILIGSRTLAHRDATNNLCTLQVFLLIMESRNLHVTAARLSRLLITIIIMITVCSAEYFITNGIAQPRNHNRANQTMQATLHVCEHYL